MVVMLYRTNILALIGSESNPTNYTSTSTNPQLEPHQTKYFLNILFILSLSCLSAYGTLFLEYVKNVI